MDWIQNLEIGMTALELELLGKLLLAAFLGGVIGWEREASDKPAGLRTNLLICVGAALLTHVSINFASASDPAAHIRADPARIAAQIVSGIGFLGAGTIIQARGSVTGLTTAATLWVVAAIGIAVGGGAHFAATGATALVLIALIPLGWIEDRIEDRRSRHTTLRLTVSLTDGVVERAEAVLHRHEVDASVEKVSKSLETGQMEVFLAVRGASDALRSARRELLAHEEVRGLTVIGGARD